MQSLLQGNTGKCAIICQNVTRDSKGIYIKKPHFTVWIVYRAVLTEGGRQEMHDSGPPPGRPEEDPSLRSVILRVPPFNNYNTFLGLGRPQCLVRGTLVPMTPEKRHWHSRKGFISAPEYFCAWSENYLFIYLKGREDSESSLICWLTP